jgi:multidrug efflux pump subunit AcrA (membrane-fusion protein)
MLAANWIQRHATLDHAPRSFSTQFFAVLRVLGVVVATAHLAGCGPAHSAGGPGEPPPVSVVPVTQRNLQAFDDFSARVEAVDSVEPRSRVAGSLDQVHFVEGQRVAKGALLFSIDRCPFAAEVAKVSSAVERHAHPA